MLVIYYLMYREYIHIQCMYTIDISMAIATAMTFDIFANALACCQAI